MNIGIDKYSGFCFGVVYAIQMAEEELERSGELFCLGDIVHNNVEVERLKSRGLITIDHEKFRKLKDCKVLIRAHGEPPDTYRIALQNNIELIDTSCPVVLKLQNKIKMGFDEIMKDNGQIVIYGREGHAEVNALVGQTNGKGIVISDLSDIDKIDFSRPVNIFSQTTQSTTGYHRITDEIKKRYKDKSMVITNDTICRQVANRNRQLHEFVKKHDIVIFVSGAKSSNGKMLYNVCKDKNPNTYFVSDIDGIRKEWFANAKSAGICGATSTPMWLMEKIADEVKKTSVK